MTAQIVADMIDFAGEEVTLRRPPATDVSVKASIRRYDATDLSGSLIQGTAEIHLSCLHVAATGFPEPPQQNDKIIRDGKMLNIESCELRNFREEPALYILRVRG